MDLLFRKPKTFEGTWEEVIRHGSELAGRRVLLTVLDDARPQTTLDSALDKIIEEAENLAAIRPPTSRPLLVDDWGEGVVSGRSRSSGCGFSCSDIATRP